MSRKLSKRYGFSRALLTYPIYRFVKKLKQVSDAHGGFLAPLMW